MPARDTYHDAVKAALIKDGWRITHDPLRLSWGGKDFYVDIGAEKLIGAEKDGKKIAVEIKSFVGASPMFNLEVTLGQLVLYSDIMQEVEPDRELILAVRQETLEEVFEEPIGKLVIEKRRLKLLVFDQDRQEIAKWLP